MRKIILLLGLVFFLALNLRAEAETTYNLKESIETALKNNLSIILAEEKLFGARGKIKEAKAGKFPTLSLDSTYTRLGEAPSSSFSISATPEVVYSSTDNLTALGFTPFPPVGSGLWMNPEFYPGASMDMTFSDVNIYDLKLTLKQPVWTFGRLENAHSLAKLSYRTTLYEYNRTKAEVIFNVKKAYFGVLQTKHFVKVAQAAVDSVKGHLKTAKDLKEQGVVAKYDVLRAEVALADAEQILITARNALSLAKAGFAATLGPGFNPEEIDVAEIPNSKFKIQNSKFKLEDLTEKAYKERPEILQLKASIEMAERGLKLAKANNKPVLMLVGNYDYKKGDKLPAKWKDDWNATLALSFPFFDSGATSGKVKQASSQLKQAEYGLEQLRQAVALEVRQSLLDLGAAEEKISAAKKSVEQAEEGLRLAKERYEYGVGTSVEVTDAQTALTQAQTNYYNALYEYQLAQARLEKATGEVDSP